MTIRGSMRYLSRKKRKRGRSFEYLNNSEIIHWGTGPKVASIRKRLKPEIVIDFIKTIAIYLTLYTVNIIPYSMIRLNYVYKKIMQWLLETCLTFYYYYSINVFYKCKTSSK